MYLVVGLGNPDKKYENTYHNMGFMVVDALAEKLGVKFTKKTCQSKTAELFIGGEKVVLAKPQTYMNLSGQAVKELVRSNKTPLENLIIVYDDYDLPSGALRIRRNGSAGTHNGMRDIVYELDTTEFPRIRIGIKPETEIMPLINYVLSNISDKTALKLSIDGAVNALNDFISGSGIEKLMKDHNATK